MAESPPNERLVLVSCAECGRLHEPQRAMSLNPVCATCTAAPAGLTAPDER